MMHQAASNGDKKPCRTCTDFKTWAKQQQNVYKAKSEVSMKRKFKLTDSYIFIVILIFKGKRK